VVVGLKEIAAKRLKMVVSQERKTRSSIESKSKMKSFFGPTAKNSPLPLLRKSSVPKVPKGSEQMLSLQLENEARFSKINDVHIGMFGQNAISSTMAWFLNAVKVVQMVEALLPMNREQVKMPENVICGDETMERFLYVDQCVMIETNHPYMSHAQKHIGSEVSIQNADHLQVYFEPKSSSEDKNILQCVTSKSWINYSGSDDKFGCQSVLVGGNTLNVYFPIRQFHFGFNTKAVKSSTIDFTSGSQRAMKSEKQVRCVIIYILATHPPTHRHPLSISCLSPPYFHGVAPRRCGLPLFLPTTPCMCHDSTVCG
jgi:hypothetical protein